jgi:hypothetical protein
MNKETENLIKKIMAKDIEIKMFNRESEGLIISKEIVLEILKELTEPKYPNSFISGNQEQTNENNNH